MTDQKRILRLTLPALDFYVDVKLTEYPEGRGLAVADFAGQPDVGTGHDPREALRAALDALGEPDASEMARDAELGDGVSV
jgi:hypothetical protein